MPSRSVSEVAERFAEYVAEVAERGETLVVTRDGQPIVELRPTQRGRTVREFVDMIPSLPDMGDDREQFARDLEAAHEAMNSQPLPPDPWGR